MDNVFWLGVYPGLGEPQIDFVIETLRDVAEHGLRRSSNGAAAGRVAAPDPA